MFVDARNLPSETAIDCDVCVIGGGAAGITIARELTKSPLEICLLESGGLDYEEDTQALYAGEVVGAPYPAPDVSRMRYFGGTTNHWAGGCTPLDPIDFEVRPWVEHSGWPIDRAELDPYYRRAQRYVELGPPRYDAEFWAELLGHPPLALDRRRMVSSTTQESPPTLFGEVYRADLDRAANLTVYLHASVVAIGAAGSGDRVDSVRAGVLDGGFFTVTARHFVLAMGGIENPRMLLVSNDVHGAGLGNRNGLVGRYFMDHPVVEGVAFHPSDPALDLGLYVAAARNGTAYDVSANLKLAEETLRAEALTNLRIPFQPVTRYYLSDGIDSYHRLASAFGDGRLPDDFWRHVGNVAGDIDMVAEAVSRKLLDTRLFASADEVVGYLCDTMIEQTPNPESRVLLGDARDAFGLRRVRIDLRVAERDRENLWRAYEVFAAEIGRAGHGRVRILRDREQRLWDDLLSYGHHHMGTTRMHDDPRRGVVDRHCRVHDLSNLHVAGSSVFPTGGHVPPTLTIVALAIRLADRIRAVATGQPATRRHD